MIWAREYDCIGKAFPYRIEEDNGDFPQGFINDLSIVMDAKFYKPTNEHSIFYQPDIELRKKALLGIIISDVNSKMSKRKPLNFDLTEQNLDEVIKKIQEKDFF